VLVLDSGGVSHLAGRSERAVSRLLAYRRNGLWPPTVPSIVLVECLTGQGARDASAHRLLNTCEVSEMVPERLARRAALLRASVRRGSAVDALVVALAEPGGTVLTSDPDDLRALAAHAADVMVQRV
jgi:hypothetical protein